MLQILISHFKKVPLKDKGTPPTCRDNYTFLCLNLLIVASRESSCCVLSCSYAENLSFSNFMQSYKIIRATNYCAIWCLKPSSSRLCNKLSLASKRKETKENFVFLLLSLDQYIPTSKPGPVYIIEEDRACQPVLTIKPAHLSQ